MRVLFVGDVIGRPGRTAVKLLVPSLVHDHGIDLTIANGENAAGGIGITPEVAKELLSSGVDVITTGNHVWHKKEIYSFIDQEERLLRPANYPPGNPGKEFLVKEVKGHAVAVVNLCGRVFMPHLDCPFRCMDGLLKDLKSITNLIIVDFHGEATSEKYAIAWYLDGRVSAVVGTHTHVPTADERILPGGTAYITDVGMVGSTDSVIGVRKEEIIERFLTQRPISFSVAKGHRRLDAVVIDINEKDGRATSIQRINLDVD